MHLKNRRRNARTLQKSYILSILDIVREKNCVLDISASLKVYCKNDISTNIHQKDFFLCISFKSKNDVFC